MKHSVSSWAKAVGYTFAHMQHGIDKATEWGLHRIRESQEQRGSSGSGKSTSGNPFLRFLGESGEAYYRVYEKLKRGK